jgi:radical SAM protein with 4Fe4S-binding SPASM domain
VLATGLDSLGISMESFDSEQFEHLRPGSKYERVIEGIRAIAQLRHEREKPLHLELWVSILQETLDQVDRIAQFALEVGIDSLQFQPLNTMPAYMRFYTPELKKNLLSVEDLQRMVDDPTTLPILKSSLQNVIAWYQGQRCEIFMHSAMVNWEGLVSPCCFLKTPAFKAFGNISLEEFESIWQRTDYRFFRFALQHGVVLESCQGCPSVAAIAVS